MPEVRSTDPEEFGTGRVWLTASKSRPNVRHVTMFTEDEQWLCTCEGMRYHSNCRHVDELKELIGIDDDDFEVSL
jgi:hypothetical protein